MVDVKDRKLCMEVKAGTGGIYPSVRCGVQGAGAKPKNGEILEQRTKTTGILDR